MNSIIGVLSCSLLVAVQAQQAIILPVGARESVEKMAAGASHLLARQEMVLAVDKIACGAAHLVGVVAVAKKNAAEGELECISEAVQLFDEGVEQLNVQLDGGGLRGVYERKLIADALSELFFHAFSMILFPNTPMNVHVRQIVSSILKILSACVLEGGIKKDDLHAIQDNFHEALGTRMIMVIKRDAQPSRSEEKPATPDVDKQLEEEKVVLKKGFLALFSAAGKMLVSPGALMSYLFDLIMGLFDVARALLADGKLDAKDSLATQEVIAEIFMGTDQSKRPGL